MYSNVLALIVLMLAPLIVSAQCGGTFQVLHYTETTGYDHNTRNQSLSMFQSWENTDNFVVTSDDNGDEFNSLSNLQQYAVVVFSNTSGDNGLNASQRANFEAYIAQGGSYLGIHAASDTYRHSTANGGSTGEWDWYAETVAGASVQQSPNHTNQNHNNTMTHEEAGHPTLANVPDPWNKTEEYYYWENGYLSSDFTELLRVASTGGNSYDAPRMMAHCNNLAGGGRAFYTALGHSSSNYTNDQNFQNLIHDALLWAADPNIGSGSGFSVSIVVENEIACFGENGSLRADLNGGTAPFTYQWDSGSTDSIATGLTAGTYMLTVTDSEGCVASDDWEFTQPDRLDLEIETSPNTDSAGTPNGEAEAIVGGGTQPYSFAWTGPNNFTSSSQAITGLEAGDYAVTVTDDQACQTNGTGTVEEVSTNIEGQLGIEAFMLNPNPTRDVVRIDIQLNHSASTRAAVMDIQGKTLWESAPLDGRFSTWTLETRDWPVGVYLVMVYVDGQSISRRLLIQ